MTNSIPVLAAGLREREEEEEGEQEAGGGVGHGRWFEVQGFGRADASIQRVRVCLFFALRTRCARLRRMELATGCRGGGTDRQNLFS
jgi:hypothetical protein